MNLLKGAAPTAAPSFFLHSPPPSGFVYAVAPATALIVTAPPVPAIRVYLCRDSRHGPYCRRPSRPRLQGLSVPWLPPRPFLSPPLRPRHQGLLCRGSRHGPYCRRPRPLFPLPIAVRVRPCHRRAVAMSLSHCGPSTRCGSPPALVCIIIYDYLCGKIIVPYWRHREPYPHAN